MSYSGKAIFKDMSPRIPPDWECDESLLYNLSLETYETKIERKNSNKKLKPEPVTARFLTEADFDSLAALHHKVIDALPVRQIFRSDGLSFIHANLDRRGRTVGAFLDGQLIGYAVISFPKADADNLGNLAPIPEVDHRRVAHYDGAAVDPDFRGNNLHRFMNDIRGNYAIAAGYYHLMGTVSPLNPYSLGNHLRAGFGVVNFAVKYDDMDRLIIYRNGLQIPLDGTNVGEKLEVVSLSQLDLMRDMLKQGYKGKCVVKIDGDYKVEFSK